MRFGVFEEEPDDPLLSSSAKTDRRSEGRNAPRLSFVRAIFGNIAAFRFALDAFAVGLSIGLAFLFRFGFGWLEMTEVRAPEPIAHTRASIVWVLTVLFAFSLNRLYDEDTLTASGGELGRIMRSLVEAVAVLSFFVFFTRGFSVSRGWVGFLVPLTALTVASERKAMNWIVSRLRARGRFRTGVYVLSRNAPSASEFEGLHEFTYLGHLDPETFIAQLRGKEASGKLPRRDAASSRVTLLARASEFSETELWEMVLAAGSMGYPVFLHSSVRSVGRDRLTVRELGRHTIVKIAPPRLTGFQAIAKRSLDVALSATLLVLTFPLLLAISAGVLATSGWPILFGQERIGKDGARFTMWKFRSMRRDAEVGIGPRWATENDPRRTPLGRFLRRTSLDELPQLWNVLKGEMSMVGPRPEMSVVAEQFLEEVPEYGSRQRMRPGLTGLAQATGWRGNTSIHSRIERDNWYIEHWSMILDIKIILQTVREVVAGRNAY